MALSPFSPPSSSFFLPPPLLSFFTPPLPPLQSTRLQGRSGRRGVCVLPRVGRAGRVALVSVCPPPTAPSVAGRCASRDLATTQPFVQVSPAPSHPSPLPSTPPTATYPALAQPSPGPIQDPPDSPSSGTWQTREPSLSPPPPSTLISTLTFACNVTPTLS